jgi:hypothetical protein
LSLVNAPTALCKGGGDRPLGNSIGVLLGRFYCTRNGAFFLFNIFVFNIFFVYLYH